MIKNKKAITLPFNWLFAIVVGCIILLLAIYGAVKFVGTGEKVVATESAAKLVAVLEQMSVAGSGKSSEIKLGNEVKIYLGCDALSNRPFGKQSVSFAEKIRGKFGERGSEIGIKNKYVFGDEIEGKNLYLFSKPFKLGYKVGDLIMISSEDYCFYKTPSVIRDEIENLNVGIEFVDDFSDCSDGIRVCFAAEDCDVEIISNDNYESGKVVKDGSEVYFVGNLIFAGIFSSSEIYECNVKRLKARFDELAFIYGEKIKILEERGCRSDIRMMLSEIKNVEVSSSADLRDLVELSENINLLNIEQPDGCEVW